jgi:hypothetical protein
MSGEKAVSLQADYYQERDNKLNYSALTPLAEVS